MKRLKVLVSAYACEPHKGSEPGVGWNWTKQIAKFAEVWVITRANNKETIDHELYKEPDTNLHFIYYDLPSWLGFWKRKVKGLYLYYFLWQIGAFFLAKKLTRSEQFDLVHQLTFGNIWLPTFMPFLSVPFIWGPIGGGEQVPRAFRKDYAIKAKFIEALRDTILGLLKINPLYLFACKRALFIIVRTNETLNRIPSSYRDKTIKMIETGVEESDNYHLARTDKKDDIQIVSVGRLIHLKGFDLTLKAFSEAIKKNLDAKYIIIGDGPERNRLHRICQERKVSDRVFFTGQIGHDEVIEYLSNSSIFLFPSLKEGGPWALFEAMSCSLPVICLDIAGPAEVVNDDCGIRIKPITPEQTIKDLAEAIVKLTNDAELRECMGRAGKDRVKTCFSWDKKGEFVQKMYAEGLNGI